MMDEEYKKGYGSETEAALQELQSLSAAEDDTAAPESTGSEETAEEQSIADAMPSWAQDLLTTQELIRGQLSQHDKYLRNINQERYAPESQKPAPQAQPQYDRQPQRALTDIDAEEIGKRFEAMEKRAQVFQSVAKALVLSNFAQAEKYMDEKYADFNKYVPAENRRITREQIGNNIELYVEMYGTDYDLSVEMERAYKLLSYDDKQAARQADELSTKRQQKKQASVTSAAKVPPSGASYQAPQEKFDANQRGYRDVRALAYQALEAGG